MKRFIAGCMAALTLFSMPAALAKNVTATGVGVTANEAENDALRNAVENTLGVYVDAQTLVSKNVLINDNIYTNSRGFITDYNVRRKRQTADGGWEVVLDAVVDDNPDSSLMSALARMGIIENNLRNPKIAVYIPEKHIQYRVPDPAGETAVIKALIEAGFSNVIAASPKIPASALWADKGYAAVNIEDMRAAARFFDADIVVIGEGFSEGVGDPGRWLPGNQRTNMQSCRARVEAKMYIAKTGQIIAADGKYGSGLDISQAVAGKKALASAGQAIGEYFAGEIMNLGAGNRQSFELVVASADFAKINAIQAALGRVHGVNNAQLSKYSGGKGTFSLRYSGSPQTLLRELQSLTDFDVTLISSGYNTMDIRLG